MATTKSPLIFTILAECHTSKARTSRMILQHGVVDTPVFMPVGTQVNERKKNICLLQEIIIVGDS
jgi:tRNA-guanine family transglycosylase